MRKNAGRIVGAVLFFFAGAVSLPLVQAQDSGPGFPEMPSVGDRLVVYGQGDAAECDVTSVRGNWVKCGGTWRNLVTGAAFMFQSKGK